MQLQSNHTAGQASLISPVLQPAFQLGSDLMTISQSSERSYLEVFVTLAPCEIQI